MAGLQLRVVLPFRTGFPEDVTVNTWAIAGTLDITSGPLLLTAIDNFFNATTTTSGQAVCEFMSPALNRETNAVRLEVYEIDLVTGSTGSPLAVNFMTLGEGPSSPDSLLPNEVAICTSFAAEVESGAHAQRRRGRVYIGPLTDACCVHDTDNFQPTVLHDAVTTISDATQVFQSDVNDAGLTLAVWSRVDQELFPVVRGWVDTEFDTQRRRGIRASTRVTWTGV